MTDEPREIELKFSLAPARGPEVLAWIGQGRRHASHEVISIYFDTEAQALRKAGFVLRVRCVNGGWAQAVKSRAAAGGKLGRGEWEAPVDGPAPDLAMARRTPAGKVLKAEARVTPLFTVKVRRLALDVRMPDSVIEAALDSGVVETDGRRAPVDELELELKSGRPASLFRLARRLQEAFGADLAPSVVTKADRGFALLEGGGLTPRHFQAPALDAAMTAGAAFQAMARSALDQILWNAEILRSEPDPEAIHQMRVGVRRLRSTLATFKRVIADDTVSQMRARLKWLAGEVAPARALDVFIQSDLARSAQADEALAAQRTAAYARARAAAGSEAMRALVMDVQAWIEFGAWTHKTASGAKARDRSAGRFAAKALDKARARVINAGAGLAKLSPEDRHQVRIRAKALRYAADVFDQLFTEHPKRTRRFLKALEALLQALGDLNDLVAAEEMALALPGAPDMVTHETKRKPGLLKDAARAFKALEVVEPYWPTKT